MLANDPGDLLPRQLPAAQLGNNAPLLAAKRRGNPSGEFVARLLFLWLFLLRVALAVVAAFIDRFLLPAHEAVHKLRHVNLCRALRVVRRRFRGALLRRSDRVFHLVHVSSSPLWASSFRQKAEIEKSKPSPACFRYESGS